MLEKGVKEIKIMSYVIYEIVFFVIDFFFDLSYSECKFMRWDRGFVYF